MLSGGLFLFSPRGEPKSNCIANVSVKLCLNNTRIEVFYFYTPEYCLLHICNFFTFKNDERVPVEATSRREGGLLMSIG